jgi:hypothetical protein
MKTTVIMSTGTRDKIKKFGRYGETMEDIIIRAFGALEEKQGKDKMINIT